VKLIRVTSALIAVVCVAALGSGALQYLHELDHAKADARQDAMVRAAGLPVGPHHHDEANCRICVQLHMAYCEVGWKIWLSLVGALIACAGVVDIERRGRAAPGRIGCRGPPMGLGHIV
jgi:hypothetical protein